MSCARHTSAIVDHACGAEIAADAAAHLEGCAACRRVFEEQLGLMQTLDGQLAQALDIQPSPRFVPEVIARVEHAAARKRTVMWWTAPAAAAAVVILVTFGSLRSGERRAADSKEAPILSAAASAPADPTPSANASSRNPGEEPRPALSRRRGQSPAQRRRAATTRRGERHRSGRAAAGGGALPHPRALGRTRYVCPRPRGRGQGRDAGRIGCRASLGRGARPDGCGKPSRSRHRWTRTWLAIKERAE